MAKIELTLQEARSQSANFMYVFASDKYLSLIDQKYAPVIRGKRDNQIYVLKLSADKYLGDFSKWTEYKQAVREGFQETYGMTPAQALEKLALGQTVAGKNWSEGVYGIGELYPTTFKAVWFNDNEYITVDPKTGHLFRNGVDITNEKETIYGVGKDASKAFQLFSYPQSGDDFVFMSEYNKTGKRYVAKSYVGDDGNTHNGRTGDIISPSDGATVWGNIQLGIENFNEILTQLLSALGIKLPSFDFSDGEQPEQINAANTLPNQKADGYATEAGIGEAGAILLALAGGGLLLASAKKKKSKK